MSSDIIAIVRVVLLVAAVLQLAMATVFFERLQNTVVRPMLRLAESKGSPVPRAIQWVFTSRAFPLAMTAVPLFFAWFLGTPAAADLLMRLPSGS